MSKHDASDVARAYDRWAATYDSDRNLTRDLDARVVRAAPLRLDGAAVLELGCGTGKNTAWLATQARSVTALDFSAEMLAVARRAVAAEHVRFVQHDLRMPWPVADASIDVAVGNLVLEHIESLAPVFAEAARAVRAGGQLFLCELHPARQLRGGQAHFADAATGDTVQVPAFVHSVSEFVNESIAAGFIVRRLGEWIEDDAPVGAPPRLLSLLFERAPGDDAATLAAR